MKYKIKDSVLWKIVDGEAVIVNNNEEVYSYLNTTGTEVWKMISEDNDFDDIVKNLADNYDSDIDSLKNDVSEIIDELLTQELIEKSQ